MYVNAGTVIPKSNGTINIVLLALAMLIFRLLFGITVPADDGKYPHLQTFWRPAFVSPGPGPK